MRTFRFRASLGLWGLPSTNSRKQASATLASKSDNAPGTAVGDVAVIV